MDHGPIDFVMIGFPDTEPANSVAEGIRALEDSGTVQVIDLIFVKRDLSGDVHVTELNDLEDSQYDAWESIVDEFGGFLAEDDALQLASDLEPGTSAVLVVYENTWARALTSSVLQANGQVMINARIPRDVVAQMVASAAS